MKLFTFFLLALASLSAQTEIGKIYTVFLGSGKGPLNLPVNYYLSYLVTRTGPNAKEFAFNIASCFPPKPYWDPATDTMRVPPITDCTYAEPSFDITYGSVVDAKLSAFENAYPNATFTKSFGAFSQPSSTDGPKSIDTVPLPTTQPDPYFTYLDGLGNSILKVDLTTFAIVSRVVVPSTSGPFGIRPTPTGPGNEAWVANGGLEVSVVDLGTQQLLANILTPSIPQAVAPAGIVFTNSGATALEAVQFYSTDSSGNNGALLVFDVAARTVKSTLRLKYGPAALLMAPDGLTAYLLSSNGELTYYDVLSGTADQSVSTYTPGMGGGYGLGSNVFAHPDGTRLIWNVGAQLEVFDLTTHRITKQFNSGLPSTSAVSMEMSQDGWLAFMSNGVGNFVILDTRTGSIWSAGQSGTTGAQFFGTKPIN